MYSIYANGVCIYNDVFSLDTMKVINPKLILSDCAAGSLSITLPPNNVGYATIERMITDISVEKDGEEIWMGRVLTESKDFWNNRVLYCEGELAFFNDSTQPPKKYGHYTIQEFLSALIDIHNAKVGENRRFCLGAVTVHDDTFPDFFTNYEKTMELINSLIEKYGGHMRVRKKNGVRYLDYLKECPNTCAQTIQMGVNLIDFTKSWDMTDFATVIVPLGARLKKSPIKELDAYLTVEEVNNGSIYVQSDEAVKAYGWIEKSVTWDDVVKPNALLEKAQKYLSDLQFDNMVLELSALDMHYLDIDVEAVKLLDEIRVISFPHGLDRMFPVTELEIPLDSPEKTQFKLGDTVKTSLTEVNNQINSAIRNQIDLLPKEHNILDEAKANATEIMNLATTGFITITRDEEGSDTLYISNERDYTCANKLWKWNLDGLGFSNDGGKTYEAAFTKDGSIVADRITTGAMSANHIRTGVLKSENDNTVFNLDTGELTMKSGSIQLGAYDDKSKHYKFEVDKDGNLYAGNGIFAGELVGVTGTFWGTVQAEDFLDANGNSMMNNGKFKGEYLDLMGIHVLNKDGGTVMTIDERGVRFGNGFSPVKHQYSTSAKGPWHDSMQPNDRFRRESVDGGETWGNGYQFVGIDGQPGDDADVTYDNIKAALQKAAKTKTSFITADEMGAPTIYGGKIFGGEFYAGTGGNAISKITENGISFYNSKGAQIMVIGRSMADGPIIGGGGHGETLYFSFSEIDFSSVGKIKGLHAVFA